MDQPGFDISIIVPTFNRAPSLRRFLDSVERLEFPQSITLEVLIIDNRCTDGTRDWVAAEQQRRLRYSLKLFREEQQGQSAAINCGLRNCRGRIICLVDDDVVLDSRWISGLLESYETGGFDALQGRVLPGVDPEGKPADAAKLHYYNIPIVDLGEQIRPIRGLTGAHMTFRREVFEKVGCFDVRLGPGASGFSGDTEFSRRVRAAGFRIGYTPKARVFHELDPARYGRRYNRAVQYRKGLSRSLYRKESMFGKVLPEFVGNCFKFCIYAALGNSGKIYRTEGRILRGLGYLRGRVRSNRGRE